MRVPIIPYPCQSLILTVLLKNYCYSTTVVSIFTPPHPPVPSVPASHPRPYPLWLYPCVLYTCSLMALPLLSCLTSALVPVSLFFISMSPIIFCFFICFVESLRFLTNTQAQLLKPLYVYFLKAHWRARFRGSRIWDDNDDEG